MIDEARLTLFLYITARMTGFVLFNPILGRRSFPGIFRVGFIMALSVTVASFTEQSAPAPRGMLELMLRFILELALGYLLGTVMNFFFYIPQLAGEVIDTQLGMTMNQIYDSSAQANFSTTGIVLNVMMTLLFFVANGHHTLLRIMLTSGQVVPFGAAVVSNTMLQAALELFVQCTVLAVKLCLPILAAELVGQVGMGVLMKVIPQINVFSINIELKVIIGLTLLFLFISPFGEFLLKAEHTMLNSLHELLTMAV